MTWAEFTPQMDRLINTFGKGAYGEERIKLIWREVQEFGGTWWAKTVDHLILECRQAPLMEQFGFAISQERDRVWRNQKKQNDKDAKDFFKSAYAPEDEKTLCQYIVKRMQGGVSDADFKTFTEHLKYTAKQNPSAKGECSRCTSGYVLTDDNRVYRCICPLGDKLPKTFLMIEVEQPRKEQHHG